MGFPRTQNLQQYLNKELMKKPKSEPKRKGKSKSKDISKDIPKDEKPAALQIKKSKSKANNKKEESAETMQTLTDFSLNLIGGVYTIKLHSTFEIRQEDSLFKNIKGLFELYLKKEQHKDMKLSKHCKYSYFPSFEFNLRKQSPKDQKCSICQFEFDEVNDFEAELVKDSDQDIVIMPCSHLFHINCLKMLISDKEWVKCPVCSTIFGQMIGDQPNGSMTWTVHKDMHCDGYESVGSIIINYSMNSGKRGDISFPGTHRTAYLPDNKQGNQVLQLLHKAFTRKLIFTIGRSVTTGRDNQVVWNGIHHKTNTSGGSAYFGYPDPTYFDRVKLQLAAKGVV